MRFSDWSSDVCSSELVARRLTSAKDGAMELWPSWSRDGKSLVFVRWTDAGLGEIHVTGAGGGASRKVTGTPGHYAEPRLSPDGKTIVFERRGGGGLTSERWGEDPGVYRIAAAGGKAERIDRKSTRLNSSH